MEKEPAAGMSYSKTLNVADRIWQITATPIPAFLSKIRDWHAPAGMIGIFLITVLTALYQNARMRRSVVEAQHMKEITREIKSRRKAEASIKSELAVNEAFAGLSKALITKSSITGIADLVLQAAKRITGSKYGYVGYVDPMKGFLVSFTLTGDIGEVSGEQDKTVVFEEYPNFFGSVLHQRRSLRLNDVNGEPWSTATPLGHILIRRFLSAPALTESELVGQVALINKEEEFNDHDMNIVERLVDILALAIRRSRTEQALKIREEQFRGAFEHSAIGITFVSAESRFLKVNPSLCKIVGYTEQELLSRTFQDITHPDDLEADLGYVRKMLAGEMQFYHMEKRYVHKRGHVVWGLLSVSLVRDDKGSPIHFVSPNPGHHRAQTDCRTH